MQAPELITTVQALPVVQALGADATLRAQCDRPTLCIPAHALVALATQLRDTPELRFDLLETHTAIDWIEQDRLELLYLLTSIAHGHHLTLSVSIDRDEPLVPTLCFVYPIAEWLEREAYDMFGILYDGHPDLRRLFLEDDWVGFPLRKDYEDDFMLERPE